ncbi:MAG: serine hydroxymethyltransferase [Chlamydiae bacterium RIFCSPHIGHO2_12_FULL_44_59]|nr:MAG: serine hydroxymethyltransferase [Chlamydiae bacterium RIFCSPHIGHO2_01_FULL_44_39]OGN59774.1 MAG: serine hydroxymethyltransferase [Chlamydiae bacterium RIFCSPHIGHO2_12_FULL_44_59]OGN65872.1 MAG: serine hydroxymethyltransferase [Chlamydiae bacterium RIFCSPLOWO2_01_FULL_44_52]OGN68282.1 MAG: serine hydroxymethyltransferase [Chlamydiae bacterium RIFCSPLOWO2_02_FULL_45_22]OGN69592.1 MAG: serine hydroxymethyltransferase [Chlamydiae bacterium RIFCSPLOWO2_12_FULL_45_20]
MTYLKKYFAKFPEHQRTSSAIAYMAALDAVAATSPIIADSILKELESQRSHLKLIASENFSSLPCQLAMGNLFTDKYSEGYVGHRFYAGCENIDRVEGEAVALAKKLFNAEHAYVQPHSGADANLVAFWAILVHKIQNREVEKLGRKSLDELSAEEYERVRQLLVNQRIMGLSLGSGGHLTHGYRHNVSAKMFQSFLYDINFETGRLDYKQLEKQVKEVKPFILIAGYSAYPRLLDFAKMREIADSVGAVLLVDMAHFSGLVAGGVLKGNYNPVPYAQILTTTTHKMLRGPRGGLILSTEEYREVVNKGCPIVLGGPLPHVMAAKVICFQEALTPAYREYAQKVVTNAQSLAEGLKKRGARVLTDGTDNHLVVVDAAASFGLTGRQAELALREANLTVNRNSIPQDVNGAWYTSGIRLGTPALTTLGMKEQQMEEIADVIVPLLKKTKAGQDLKTAAPSKAKIEVSPEVLESARQRVRALLKEFPLYPELG